MRGIVFDLDDTLYARDQWVRSGLEAVARYVSATHDCSHVAILRTLTDSSATHPGREIDATCRALGWPASTAQTLLHVLRTHEPNLTLPPASAAVLQSLRSDGWRLGILTNGPAAIQARKVAALQIDVYVDAVVYAEEHAPGGKPAAAAFQAVLALLGVPPSRVVLVGDDPVADIEGGRRAGLATVRLRRATQPAPSGLDADLVLDHLEQVPGAAARLLAEVTSHVA